MQETLEERSGLPMGSVCGYEYRQRMPSYLALFAMSKAIGVEAQRPRTTATCWPK